VVQQWKDIPGLTSGILAVDRLALVSMIWRRSPARLALALVRYRPPRSAAEVS